MATMIDTPKAGDELEESSIKKFRVQLDFNAVDFDTINALVKQLGLGTRAELFRSAVLALQWMVERKEQGYTVVATNFDGRYLEPGFSFLRNVSVDRNGPSPGDGPFGKAAAAATKVSAAATVR